MQHDATTNDWRDCTSYWEPPHIVPSAWIEHTPFAYWLMNALRPAVVAELGTHYGFSYFVFSEAARRLGLDTRVFGIDTWQGDDHAGFYSDEVYNAVAKINKTDYSTVGSLLRCTFDDALDEFEDGSIDLLHIDGRHGFEDVRHDFSTWLPKLSDSGVIIMHDIAARRPGFGVWQYWEEILREYPSAFGFEHGFGLGVVPVGHHQRPELEGFFRAAAQNPAEIRDWYSTVGGRIGARAEANAKVRRALDRIEARAQTDARAIASLTEERDALLASTSWRITRPMRALGGMIARVRR
ncbi:class I SAM-dependent methyltransferase [Chryseoglobus sp. 28M-23]|uniref:class I SAM-dependent methyltransferase n=1 Tax=Chryseoglobus sp. 28M-23 TaxID=2772253 RepID=UPI001745DBB7|nr:class I SAM-dependent methyltransferase [Chryseoglobus sp. 28M-23]QOD93247.1 class I SAM-dependent methyltransferase [Chryseoglobus sp. 28M-23]